MRVLAAGRVQVEQFMSFVSVDVCMRQMQGPICARTRALAPWATTRGTTRHPRLGYSASARLVHRLARDNPKHNVVLLEVTVVTFLHTPSSALCFSIIISRCRRTLCLSTFCTFAAVFVGRRLIMAIQAKEAAQVLKIGIFEPVDHPPICKAQDARHSHAVGLAPCPRQQARTRC